jgi:alanyl-tRNA synthetase
MAYNINKKGKNMNSYQKEIKTKVSESIDNYVVLNESIFHKEGGGQPSDKGWINKEKITKYDGTKFYLKNNIFKKNQEVILSINWEYRYELMKAHTAEHLLFGSLKKLNPNIEIEKIQLSEKESKIFIKGDVEFNDLIKAQILANEKINENLKINEEIVKKEDVKNARIKLDRIKDETARIIHIGNYDSAACNGTHLESTQEIILIAVIGLKKESSSITQLSFLTGKNAIEYFIKTSAFFNKLTNELNQIPEKLNERIHAILEDNKNLKNNLRKISDELLNSIAFEKINKTIFYKFESVETEKLIKKATEESKNNDVVFLKDNTLIIAGRHSHNIFEKLKTAFEIHGGGHEVKIGQIAKPDAKKIKEILLELNY